MTNGATVSKALIKVEMSPPVITEVCNWLCAPPPPAELEGLGGLGTDAGPEEQDEAVGTVEYALYPTVGVPARVVGSNGAMVPPQLQ